MCGRRACFIDLLKSGRFTTPSFTCVCIYLSMLACECNHGCRPPLLPSVSGATAVTSGGRSGRVPAAPTPSVPTAHVGVFGKRLGGGPQKGGSLAQRAAAGLTDGLLKLP